MPTEFPAVWCEGFTFHLSVPWTLITLLCDELCYNFVCCIFSCLFVVLPFPNLSDLPSVYADLSTNWFQLLLVANIFHVKIVWHVMMCLKLYHLLRSILIPLEGGFHVASNLDSKNLFLWNREKEAKTACDLQCCCCCWWWWRWWRGYVLLVKKS